MTRGLCQWVGERGGLPGRGLELPSCNSEEKIMSKDQRGTEASVRTPYDSGKDKDTLKHPTCRIRDKGRAPSVSGPCSSPRLLYSLPLASFVKTSRPPSPFPSAPVTAQRLLAGSNGHLDYLLCVPPPHQLIIFSIISSENISFLICLLISPSSSTFFSLSLSKTLLLLLYRTLGDRLPKKHAL